ncbi:hypothetical protein CFR78_11040 [Komagataeibacter rhaeticus]|uniref:flavin reductase family protein n=3 Tax=Komagataeibacter rhaeticus TaxID=215221 RepID=UPI000A03EEBF|nr:hypothetical protein CFR78_11040 [Komagataeibacter rhaeticus]
MKQGWNTRETATRNSAYIINDRELSIMDKSFREAMSRLASGVCIVATDGVAGRAGATLTSVTSVTDSPGTVLLCLNRNSMSLPAILGNGVLSINILAQTHRPISDCFASPIRHEEKFRNGIWTFSTGRCPALEGSLATLQCSIASSVESGSHTVMFCTVNEIDLHDAPAQPLIYFSRGYVNNQPQT